MSEVTLREFIDSRFESLEMLMQVEIKRLDRDAERAAKKAEDAATIAQRTEDKLDRVEQKLDLAQGRYIWLMAGAIFVVGLIAAVSAALHYILG